MYLNLTESWKNILQTEFEKPYFKELTVFVKEAYDTEVCYPEQQDIFAAFNACSFENVKVVLIGQDPYHGKEQANGLSFSVKEGVKHPPSLVNIFKELAEDTGKSVPVSGDLNSWAKQGVLLLNSTLTVTEGKAGSHQKKGWEKFTDAVILKIAEQKKQVVFLLWGGFAKKKGKKINKEKHLVLETGHPSPLSANRGYWFGNKHFSQTNAYLQKHNRFPTIKW